MTYLQLHLFRLISDGDRYEGEWRSDERHGKGAMLYASEEQGDRKIVEKYDGDWIDGKMSGRGVYHYADGSVYDGMWADGKMNGSGVFIYPNGNRYDGEFEVTLPGENTYEMCEFCCMTSTFSLSLNFVFVLDMTHYDSVFLLERLQRRLWYFTTPQWREI